MCADYLKDNLHQQIINQDCFPADPKNALRLGCKQSEDEFVRMCLKMEHPDTSGSCAIIILTVETECYIANVGDSRAILSSNSGMKVYDLSQDHRPNEEDEFYRIQRNGGQVYQTQTVNNIPITNKFGQVTGTQRQMMYGPYRVLPGKLSVSRTFGDIEAKLETAPYEGKKGVVIAEPELSQFSIDPDKNDFIVLGCDGIFDRLSSVQVIDSAWAAMAQALKQQQKFGSLNMKSKVQTIHQVSGKMTDAILKLTAIEKSYDNLTVVMVAFKNLHTFYDRHGKNKTKTQTIKIEGESPANPDSRLGFHS